MAPRRKIRQAMSPAVEPEEPAPDAEPEEPAPHKKRQRVITPAVEPKEPAPVVEPAPKARVALAKTRLRAPPQRPPRTGQKHKKNADRGDEYAKCAMKDKLLQDPNSDHALVYYQLTFSGFKAKRDEFFAD